jgi:signal transduction histidine kinase
MRISIAWKVLGLVMLLITLMGGVTGTYFIHRQERFSRDEFDRRAQMLLQSAALGFEYHVLTGNKDGLTKAAQGILANESVEYLRVFGEKNEILFEGEKKRKVSSREYRAPIMTERAASADTEAMLLGTGTTEHQRIGDIVLGVSVNEILVRGAAMKRAVMLFTAVAVIVASFLVAWLLRFLLRNPIGELAWGARSIAAGDLNYKVPTRSNDELGDLAHAFNRMTADLRKITVSRNDLVSEVEERKRVEEELRQAYENLKLAKDQLVQSEKMASIGQLAAGVAHEINNPAGFVASNLEVLETYIAGYLKMVALTNELKGTLEKGSREETEAALAKMREFEESANFEYIVNDSEKLLAQSRDGIGRIEKIVSDLKTFAREDTQWLEELVKIEDVLETTLGIAHNELKYRITVQKEYGDTPQLRCNAQKMEQVFLNLLMNAAQAIPEKGTIGIKTYEKDRHVYVDISDSGIGIPDANLKRIFDPFFTTKPAGKGTGLGLSISYELVKKQGGEIRVASEVGKGTTFTVVLPLSLEKTDKSV